MSGMNDELQRFVRCSHSHTPPPHGKPSRFKANGCPRDGCQGAAVVTLGKYLERLDGTKEHWCTAVRKMVYPVFVTPNAVLSGNGEREKRHD